MSFSTAGQKAFVAALSRLVPDVAIVVSSWGRSAPEQAAAMLSKLKRGGPQSLYDLYRDDALIKELLALPHTQAAWEELISVHGARLSKHISGGAVDLRNRDLSAANEKRLIAAIKGMGGRVIVESDHLHVDLPLQFQGGAALAVAGSVAKGAAKVATGHPLVSLLLLSAAGYAAWSNRHRLPLL